MLFNSFVFLVFMVAAFLLYWLFFNRWGKAVSNGYLVVISYVFYGWCNWKLCFLLFGWTLVTYLTGLGIGRCNENNDKKGARWLSALSIIVGIGALCYFKYTNFFIDCVASVFGTTAHHLNIVLPLGISFYTLQMLTYTIEICRGNMKVENNPVTYFAAMNFFPPLLSGPIGRAKDLLPQFNNDRSFDHDLVATGFRNILWGLFMKVIVADRFGLYVDAVYGNISQHTGTSLFVAAVAYSIQIYCDFWGYSLMAKGVAEMFGFKLIQNFNRPYFATSLREFWSRWHISLSTWFRDYVYIPLGGSRCATSRAYLNLIITFLISGLWHGAALTFCIWGLLHGMFQVVEKILHLHKVDIKNHLYRALRIAVTFLLVTFAWIFFRMPTFNDALVAIGKIFTQQGTLFVDSNTMLQMALGFAVLLTKDIIDENWPNKCQLLANCRVWVRIATYVVLIISILLFGVLDGGQFIYFQF